MKTAFVVLLLMHALTPFNFPEGQMQELGAIHGRVTNAFGSPLPGVEIRLFCVDLTSGPCEASGPVPASIQLVEELQSENDGNYSVEGVPTGDYLIEFSWFNYHAEVRRSLAPGQNMLVDIGLRSRLPLSHLKDNIDYLHGRIVDSDGIALRDATVTLSDPFESGLVMQQRSDSEGYAAFPIEKGSILPEYLLCARAQDYVPTCTIVTGNSIARHETVELELATRRWD